MKVAQSVGAAGEEIAASFLRERGWRILARNFRCRFGEVDLVARDGSTVVFVEVKSSGQCGELEERVAASQQRRLRQAASIFLAGCTTVHTEYRFDVVLVTWGRSGPTVDHIINAFQ
ncbi:MAG: YraN family protein [Bacillota bacterium]